jgi:hypothetical protein
MTSASYSPSGSPWPAPLARGPIQATVSLPGSKSLTNRELVLSALATERTRLTAPLDSRDSRLMIEALRALGTEINIEPNGDILVIPSPFDRAATIDCGLAGTVMRFVPPIAALSTQVIDFDGIGKLMQVGVEGGRKTKKDLKIGICGEHGGEPDSVKFCHKVGLNYVSCSPFRVPVAKLAAAQAVLEEKIAKEKAKAAKAAKK